MSVLVGTAQAGLRLCFTELVGEVVLTAARAQGGPGMGGVGTEGQGQRGRDGAFWTGELGRDLTCFLYGEKHHG